MLSKISIKGLLKYRLPLTASAVLAIMAFIASCRFSGAADAFNPEDAFYRANMLYGSGDYRKAALEDEKIIKNGVRSGEVYYNIGNCYLKGSEIGMALVNYERARLFMPRDSALQANYSYAKSLMKQRDPLPKSALAVQRYYHSFNLMTTGEALFTFTMVYYLFAILYSLSKFDLKGRTLIRMMAFFMFLAAIGLVIPLNHKIREVDSFAITIVKIADAKSEPLQGSGSSFPLYEGMRVNIIKSLKGWYKIKRPDGKVGWLKKSEIEKVNLQ